MTIDEIFDTNFGNIVTYWSKFGLSKKDFYCRECGKLMIDVDDLAEFSYNSEIKTKQSIFKRGKKEYIENPTNRWLIKGRTLSGKTYFRHICWDCFFKHLGEIEDIQRRARKSSWYKDVNNGILRPPASWASPSKYFKLLFDITDEELANEHKKFDTASLESFIRRHGEIDGKKKYEEYKKRQAYTCSKEYMMNEKGMTEQEWNDFNASRACTKNNFIKRYGKELGEEKWRKYCEVEAYVGCKLEYFIEKYGKEIGTEKYLNLNKQKYQCLENYIRKYGEIEGKKRWANYASKPYSNISQVLFKELDLLLGEVAENQSRWETKNGEAYIESKELKHGFHPDYMFGNKIIEFNGDYWHCNPKMYKSDELVNFHGTAFLVSDVWKRDEVRSNIIKDKGYKLKIVWEDDYIHNKSKVIEECIDFLKS